MTDTSPEALIAGRTLAEWREFARRDDCLDRMVPSDLRQLVGAIAALRAAPEAMRERVRDAFMDGAMAVHNEWARAHSAGEAPPRFADFSEAADDCASAALPLDPKGDDND